ncbi:MAG: thiol peroxidase [Candidatus Magnetomorum sp.]|nr:thiol peroxidase [Candidatus Magnetomorum sp.]
MQEQTGIVTLRGTPMTLIGAPLVEKKSPPDVQLLSNDLSPVRLSDYKGNICLISAVPSLDTPICDMQTRRFNQETLQIGGHVRVLTISVDLPFAQKRWCGASGLDHVITLSDHRETAFGIAYGVLMKEVRLLARSIFILDTSGILQYQQIVSEIGSEPDFNAALDALKQIV